MTHLHDARRSGVYELELRHEGNLHAVVSDGNWSCKRCASGGWADGMAEAWDAFLAHEAATHGDEP